MDRECKLQIVKNKIKIKLYVDDEILPPLIFKMLPLFFNFYKVCGFDKLYLEKSHHTLTSTIVKIPFFYKNNFPSYDPLNL